MAVFEDGSLREQGSYLTVVPSGERDTRELTLSPASGTQERPCEDRSHNEKVATCHPERRPSPETTQPWFWTCWTPQLQYFVVAAEQTNTAGQSTPPAGERGGQERASLNLYPKCLASPELLQALTLAPFLTRRHASIQLTFFHL